MKNIKNTNNIFLYKKNLTTLPDEVFHKKMNIIQLGANNIYLPENVGDIKCDELLLMNNNLTSLPESFGNIKCNELILNNNKLTTLPESIGNIKCNKLDLSYNNLTSLPESFGNIKCKSLDLSYNNLTSLPESIGNIKCEKLNISHNNLTSLPESLVNQAYISLHINSNKITIFPKLNKNIKNINIDKPEKYKDLINMLIIKNVSRIWLDGMIITKNKFNDIIDGIKTPTYYFTHKTSIVIHDNDTDTDVEVKLTKPKTQKTKKTRNVVTINDNNMTMDELYPFVLEKFGRANRWTKHGLDRIYVNFTAGENKQNYIFDKNNGKLKVKLYYHNNNMTLYQMSKERTKLRKEIINYINDVSEKIMQNN